MHRSLKTFLSIIVLVGLLAPWQSSSAYALTSSGEMSSVEVRYKERGKLLALMPVTFPITAKATPDGAIELEYPWYSFLTLDNKEKLETDLKVAVGHALRSRLVGSVQALRTEPQESFSAEESAVVSAEMERVLRESFAGTTLGTEGG